MQQANKLFDHGRYTAKEFKYFDLTKNIIGSSTRSTMNSGTLLNLFTKEAMTIGLRDAGLKVEAASAFTGLVSQSEDRRF